MRQMGCMFLGLTFLAGITVGTIEYAMINVVVFLLLALAVAKFLEPRFGTNGMVYGMAGAFFASFLWPYLIIGFKTGDDCVGDECLAGVFTTPSAQQAEQESASQ
ncbi:hypothetical protein [Erythrobacter rubeus]|uniref:SPW repeat-containing protein n=1 Tax=Erythrobacter rubeus TaxID=2760803 RepID=A0ABR8KRQ4_9SPHN|nr:hypothetical protein [Erythrobacter rubeus]MBD2840927.1 hypothetical protein [Erythrobacter rubeus]